MVNLYEVLKLHPNCTGVEIRRAIAKHQKNNTLTENQIKFIKENLLNPSNRAKYDTELGIVREDDVNHDAINQDSNSSSQATIVNLYELLGLSVDATENQIRQHIMQHHAAGTLDEKYLKAAKEWLLNPDIRKKYNEKLLTSNTIHHGNVTNSLHVTGSHNLASNVNLNFGEKSPDIDPKVAITSGIIIFFVLFLILKSCSSSDSPKQDSPEMTEIKLNRLGRERVTVLLKDPDSAKFRNEISFCGEVNSKNGFGAYTGYTRYIGAGESMTLLDDGSNEFNAAWQQVCTK